ncbi:kinase-like domain-containing protein [Cyathus striatus]|nr:kinase-like domain-containing protein [Cyathus striatus]
MLMYKPKLLHGFNALLQDGQRLVCCSSNNEEVEYFVFKSPENTWILPTAWHRDIPTPASSTELRSILSFDYDIKELLELDASDQYSCCLAQLLQFELDEQESLNTRYTETVTRCLYSLAKKCFIPPSLILHNVTLEEQDALFGGGFADIYCGRIHDVRLCVKALRMFQQDSDYKRKKLHSKFSREVLLWRQLSHPNVLPFFGASSSIVGRRFCLISPWMSNGNIMEYLERHPNHDRLRSTFEIIDGITYLHSLTPPVIHKDIKGANVLVTESGVCCIADFGLSSIAQTQSLNTSTGGIEGSVYWLAPEAMQFVPGSNPMESTKVDIFAFACTVYEIYTGNPPFSEYMIPFAVMLAVYRGERPFLPPDVKDQAALDRLWHLVELCWNGDPTKRPKAREVRQSILELLESSESNVNMHCLSPVSPILLDSEERVSNSQREARGWLISELTFLDIGLRTPHMPTRTLPDLEYSTNYSHSFDEFRCEITPTLAARQLPTPASTPLEYRLNSRCPLPPYTPTLGVKQLPTPASTPIQFPPPLRLSKTMENVGERRTRLLNPHAPSFIPSFEMRSRLLRSASAPNSKFNGMAEDGNKPVSIFWNSPQNSVMILDSSFASLALERENANEPEDLMILDDDSWQKDRHTGFQTRMGGSMSVDTQYYFSPPATPPPHSSKVQKRRSSQASILRADASPFVPSFLGTPHNR